MDLSARIEKTTSVPISFFTRVKDFLWACVESRYTGIVCSFLIPAVIISYSFISMQISLSWTGVFDNLVFILLFTLMLNGLLNSRLLSVRVGLSFIFVALVSVFFLSNTMYYRFFHTWGQADNIKLIDMLPLVWRAVFVLSKPVDFIFYLMVPMFLWQFSMLSFVRMSTRRTSGLLLMLIFFFTGHQAFASQQLMYVESNPFFFTIRQKIVQWRMKGDVGKVKLGLDSRKFQVTNSSLYQSANLEEFPFQVMPNPNIKPLPQAIPGKPNVVLILVESLRAYELGAYGAPVSFTPNLDRLAREGMMFKNYYAVGSQTIRGECAIHSSFNPNAAGGPIYSVKPDLSMVTLPMALKRNGYKTSWIGSTPPHITKKFNFLSQHGIDAFDKDVPKPYKVFGMGAGDEYLMDYAFDLLLKKEGPFFAEIMTLSNHFPFDGEFPTNDRVPKVEGEEFYQKYTKSVYYTDYCLGKFFEKVRKSPLAKNTVFIITGDHGIWFYPEQIKDVVMKQEIYFRGPLIFWSPSHIKPQVIDTLASQLDVTPTILDMLNIHEPNAFLGSSLFRNDTPERFIFMVQDGRWNFRKKDMYAYDVGPEIFAGHPPFDIMEYARTIKDRDMEHIFFRASHDLMVSNDVRMSNLLTIKESRDVKRFAEEAMQVYGEAIYNDRVFKKEDYQSYFSK